MGHGDAFILIAQKLKEAGLLDETKYLQVAFGEMSPAILPKYANASFITYLEAVARGCLAVSGGKFSKGEIEGKGNFFFNNDRDKLIAYTDWEQIPHKTSMTDYDRVAQQLGNIQEELEVTLNSLIANLGTGKITKADFSEAINDLRNNPRYSYFLISDEGVLFTQETLLVVRDYVKTFWKKSYSRLPKELKEKFDQYLPQLNGKSGKDITEFLQKHFAIYESKDGDKVTFDKVLLLNDGKETKIGTPYIEGAKIEAVFKEEGRNKKVMVIKFKSKSRYFKKRGHRQPFTKVEIGSIKV